ncbi:50S ribosomal protein L24 [candidate division WOR-3 bacterium]|jgi:large subunit ribosomal protein L24|uniref:Large ribosomal subunit protein uL24 n=1 Tax=candidate division TA06 bacterium TaxID=2250710 RepID=A0A660S5B0_UNCT6|nr:50S ribosomal protein L24 [candidate division WOR-3 bacterium]RKX64867.1 MAG: 50S ribosomal protein L24 [candidate division TA06 bacterium]
MAKLKLKKGDKVIVIRGKDKGKSGKILAVMPTSKRAIVEGVNMIVRHQKARKAEEQSGLIKKEAPVSIANLKLVCPNCGEPTRVGYMILENGKKARICKVCGEMLEK